ncbi:NTP transferase domain-containing protein [bacterium]|nr:NTP transferase domain-containing protein [bacterium]
MLSDIKKVIIPAAGLGTRFLPITKVLPKELLPLADKPMLNYVLEEVKDSDIRKVVFVLSERKKIILDYCKKWAWLENTLKQRGKKDLLQELQKAESDFEGISFSACWQEKPLGDGDAILKARKIIGKDACGVLFGDDVFKSKIPVISQLARIFATSQKPVIGLKKVTPDNFSSYGIVDVAKIANRLYKIKGIVEKPKSASEAPSNLAIVGRYIINSDVFEALKKTPQTEKGELILANAFKTMIQSGKVIYGYEINADWLECGNKVNWLKSNLLFCLEHPKYGTLLKDWLKKFKY